MSFPARSNFASVEDASAWYLLRINGRYQLCATTGGALVRALQRALRATPGGPSFDGTQVSGAAVAVDGSWGPTTQRALWRALRALGADPALLTIVAYDGGWRGSTRVLATPHLSRGSLLAGLWLLARLEPPVLAIAPHDVLVPNDAALPAWGVATRPGAGPTVASCTADVNAFAAGAATYPAPPAGATPALDPPSAPAASRPAPAPAPAPAPRASGTSTSSTSTTTRSGSGGATTPPPAPAPGGDTLTLPTGFETAPPATPSSTPWVLLGALAVTVAGLAALRAAAVAARDRRLGRLAPARARSARRRRR